MVAKSLPNVFKYNLVSCTSQVNNATLYIPVVASGRFLRVALYMAIQSTALSATGQAMLKIYVSGTLLESVDLYSLQTGIWSYAYISSPFHTTAGKTYTIQFSLITSASTHTFTLYVDNIVFAGAAPGLAASNVRLMSYFGDHLFNMTDYPKSTISVEYTQSVNCNTMVDSPFNTNGYSPINFGLPPSNLTQYGKTCMLDNLQTSIINVPQLGLSDLITLQLGATATSTARVVQMIPCLDPLNNVTAASTRTCNRQNIFLIPSARTVAYTLIVTDLTNHYTPHSKIFVYLGSTLMASGYIDAAYSFVVPLVPGLSYSALLVSPNNSAQTTVAINPTETSAVITIPIQSFTITNSDTSGQLSWAAGWDCQHTEILAVFTDSGMATSHVVFKLLIQNATYPQSAVIQTQSFTGVFGTAGVATFTGVSVSNSLFYTVNIYYTRVTAVGGISVNSTVPIIGLATLGVVSGGCNSASSGLFPTQFVFPTMILGLDQLWPSTPNQWLYILSSFFIIMVAAIFGARSASLGAVVVAFMTFFFMLAGWLPPMLGLFGLLLLAAAFAFIMRRWRT
jgi:hypothetical protein